MRHEGSSSILDTIRSHGYAVSEFRLPPSLLGTFPAAIEMHAVNVKTDPPEQHIARVDDDGEDAMNRCVCMLAGMAGMN